jgi:hypothetical protein
MSAGRRKTRFRVGSKVIVSKLKGRGKTGQFKGVVTKVLKDGYLVITGEPGPWKIGNWFPEEDVKKDSRS